MGTVWTVQVIERFPFSQLLLEINAGDFHVRIMIYDVAGRRVKTLVDQDVSRGKYSVTWDGKNDRGETVTSGVYFAALKTATTMKTNKMVLLR